jgi:hypothetical protein
VIKQRVQLIRDHQPSTRVSAVLLQTLNESGFRSLYRSLWVNYSMNIPFTSMMLPLYEAIKHRLHLREQDSSLWYSLSAAVAGFTATLPTTPFDVVKTRLNTYHVQDSPAKPPTLNDYNPSMLKVTIARGMTRVHLPTPRVTTTIRAIWQEQGLLGFFRGFWVRALMNIPSTAIAWGTYEYMKHRLAPLL